MTLEALIETAHGFHDGWVVYHGPTRDVLHVESHTDLKSVARRLIELNQSACPIVDVFRVLDGDAHQIAWSRHGVGEPE